MNLAFGNATGNPLEPNWEKLKSQAKNIGDEFRELIDKGIDVKNMTEVRDGICDILVFTLGLAQMAGLPVEEDMRAVYESNMSKFCKDEAEVQATIAKYNDLGIETYVEGEFPQKRVKSIRDQTDKNGKADYRKNKMMKSVAYKEPVFASL
jgi:NTP pyrophosphatase (non-canonical NTP hydrolase)